MQSVFNADDGLVPFFGTTVRPDVAFSFSSHSSDAHVPGRHLNAMLNAEDAAGIELDEIAVENHRRAAFFNAFDIAYPKTLEVNQVKQISKLNIERTLLTDQIISTGQPEAI